MFNDLNNESDDKHEYEQDLKFDKEFKSDKNLFEKDQKTANTKLKKLRRSNTIIPAISGESLKKPLFTITPSTTLLNLPNNYIDPNTIKGIVDPKSTVKIYYDEILNEKKSTDKNNEKENLHLNQIYDIENDMFIVRKKIKKRKKLLLKCEDVNGSSTYEKMIKFNNIKDNENKSKIIQEENIETAIENLCLQGDKIGKFLMVNKENKLNYCVTDAGNIILLYNFFLVKRNYLFIY